MTANQSLRRSVSWLFLGNTSTQILTFAFGIVLARLLAPAEFGMLVTIQIYTGLAGFVSGGGMGQALVRTKDATPEDYDVVFTLQILIGTIIYAAFFVASPWLAIFYDTPLYSDLLRVSALTFITRPLVNLPNSILHRNMQFKAQTGARITTLLVSSSTSIGMALAGFGVWSLIAGGLAGSLANALVLSALAHWRPRLNFRFGRGRELARYGFLVSINDIVVYGRNQVSNLIIGRLMSMSAVGLFNKADSLMRMPHAFITTSVYQVLFRALAKEQDDDEKSKRLFLQSIRLVAIYCIPCYVMLFWLATPMIGLLYGPRWIDAALPLSLLAIAGPFLMIGNLSGAVLAARNWLDQELKVQITLLVLTAAATFAGIRFGMPGIAIALICVAAFNAVSMFWLASRCIETHWTDLLQALGPAALLNSLLLLAMASLDHFAGAQLAHSDLLILLVVGGGGGIFYVLMFLLLPLPALSNERKKWIAKLSFNRFGQT